MGHEGENSLLSYLIQEELAFELSSYDIHEIWSKSILCADISLTKKGLENWQTVLEAVFFYT
jgi:secreted Zn-dependent insulinase-like peptidase